MKLPLPVTAAPGDCRTLPLPPAHPTRHPPTSAPCPKRSSWSAPIPRSLTAGPLVSNLVSCTGAQFCGFGLVETKNPAVRIAKELEQELDIPKAVRIHWTGCPNSCGTPQVGDIGLIGAPAKKDGKAVQGVRIIGGGTIGEGARLATTEFEKSVPLEDAKAVLREILIKEHGARPKSS